MVNYADEIESQDEQINLAQGNSTKFHLVHSHGVFIARDQKIMKRFDQGWGIGFSNQPIEINKNLYIKLLIFHKGVLRVGVTTHNPDNLTGKTNLNLLISQAMARNPDSFRIKEVSKHATYKDSIIYFQLTQEGNLLYGYNKKEKILFSNIEMSQPLWIVFDLTGRMLAIEIIDNFLEHEIISNRGNLKNKRTLSLDKCASSNEDLNKLDANADNLIQYASVLQNSIEPKSSTLKINKSKNFKLTQSHSQKTDGIFLNSLDLSKQPSILNTVTNTNQQLSPKDPPNKKFSKIYDLRRDSESLPQFNIRSNTLQINSKTNQLSQIETNKYNESIPELESKAEMLFHCNVGKNIFLSSDRMTATRKHDTRNNGYVFTRRPLKIGEKIIVSILQINELIDQGSLDFGLTVCDPSELEEFPNDSFELLDRPEYWVVNQNVIKNPKIDDTLAFLLTKKGEVHYFHNNTYECILMYVDTTLPLWPFFNILGYIQKISSLGVILKTKMPKTMTDLMKKSKHLNKLPCDKNIINNKIENNHLRESLDLNTNLNSNQQNNLHISSPSSPTITLETRKKKSNKNLPPTFNVNTNHSQTVINNPILNSDIFNSSNENNNLCMERTTFRQPYNKFDDILILSIPPLIPIPDSKISLESKIAKETNIINHFENFISTNNNWVTFSDNHNSINSNINLSEADTSLLFNSNNSKNIINSTMTSKININIPIARPKPNAKPRNLRNKVAISIITTLPMDFPKSNIINNIELGNFLNDNSTINIEKSNSNLVKSEADQILKELDEQEKNINKIKQLSLTENEQLKILNSISCDKQYETDECSICMESIPDCALYTCGHMCLCFECGQKILQSKKPICPMCRKPIIDVLRIYKS